MQGNYAQVNGLHLYYEIHGEGRPLIVLHGAFGTAGMWEALLPALTQNRQVILVELQAHGHTGDIDRPLSFEFMADDVAALLEHLDLTQADVFGYSMGGSVALALSIRHPERLGRVAIIGAVGGAIRDTYEPEQYQQFISISPENFNYPPVKDVYTQIAPDPTKWPVLVTKIVQMGVNFQGFATADLQAIPVPILIMFGDSEGIRLEHAMEMYRAIPKSQLAIFPGGDHFVLFSQPERVLSLLMPFLDTP